MRIDRGGFGRRAVAWAAMGAVAVAAACTREAPAAPEAKVLEFTAEIVSADLGAYDRHFDLTRFHEDATARGELAGPWGPREFNDRLLEASVLFWKADLKKLRFGTRARMTGERAAQVFLFDGTPEEPGTVNLVFDLENQGGSWIITHYDFFPYIRQYALSTPEVRRRYRMRKLQEFAAPAAAQPATPTARGG